MNANPSSYPPGQAPVPQPAPYPGQQPMPYPGQQPGQVVYAQPMQPKKPVKQSGLSKFADGVLVFLLCLNTLALLITAVLSAASASLDFRPLAGDGSDVMKSFASSIAMPLIAGVLTAVVLVILIIKNVRRPRRWFQLLGIAGIITGVLCLVLGLLCQPMFRMMSGAFRDVFAPAAWALGGVLSFAAPIFLVCSSFLLAIFMVIATLKKEGTT